jgi:hypothetical protein
VEPRSELEFLLCPLNRPVVCPAKDLECPAVHLAQRPLAMGLECPQAHLATRLVLECPAPYQSHPLGPVVLRPRLAQWKQRRAKPRSSDEG